MRNWVEASYSREREKKKTREMKRFFHVWAQFSAHSLGGLFTRYNRRVKKIIPWKIYKGKFDLNLWIFLIHLSIVTSNLREFIVFLVIRACDTAQTNKKKSLTLKNNNKFPIVTPTNYKRALARWERRKNVQIKTVGGVSSEMWWGEEK